ncbi:uncharacterized protein RSE6_06225 [Rhynchosporium secalis]|uniref:Uncharacterized protein n=1 Tax=Rhynchosporium secalis TaxID=38038 RepID=A0A1E1M9U3_RHYSE|nr:uncharacterized protein RSE6_06225 [Rhynchosporium secalis]
MVAKMHEFKTSVWKLMSNGESPIVYPGIRIQQHGLAKLNVFAILSVDLIIPRKDQQVTLFRELLDLQNIVNTRCGNVFS